MPFFKSLPEKAGPPDVFAAHRELYELWSEMSQVLMNGHSPLSPAERELEWGIEEGLVEQLVDGFDAAPVDPRLRPLLAFVRKLVLAPNELSQADADVVFAHGWDEQALHDAIAVTARAAFMQRLVEGYGFTPWTKESARDHAKKRVRLGYVNLYPAFVRKPAGEPQ
jgi:hypothetical protein